MKQFTHVFTVEGASEFPYDMLRYDCCYPTRSEDATKLDSVYRDTRKVILTRTAEKHWTPTADRWQSFSWAVVAHTYQ